MKRGCDGETEEGRAQWRGLGMWNDHSFKGITHVMKECKKRFMKAMCAVRDYPVTFTKLMLTFENTRRG